MIKKITKITNAKKKTTNFIVSLKPYGFTGTMKVFWTFNKYSYLKINNHNEIIYLRSKFSSNHQSQLFLTKYLAKFVQKQKINKENQPYNLEKQWIILWGKYFNFSYLGKGEGYYLDNKTIMIRGLNLKQAFQQLIDQEASKIIDFAQQVSKEVGISSQFRIRKMSSWGICHPHQKSITLAKKLVHFDFAIIRYVVFHELAHYFEQNHQASFWNIVAKWCPNYQKFRKQLKNW